MPITRYLTDDELSKIDAQGGDSSLYKGKLVDVATPEEESALSSSSGDNQYSTAGAIGHTLKTYAGGIGGGGAGLIASSWLLGPEVGLPVSLIGGALGAFGGGYAGQKLQDVAQGDEVTQRLQQEQAEAAKEHPIATAATDIIASALASGGKPSLNAFRSISGIANALKGTVLSDVEKQALASVALNSAVNPAINTGIGLATGQGLPSLGELGQQALGGAVFSGQADWASRLTGHSQQPNAIEEPTIDPTQNDSNKGEPQSVEQVQRDSPYITKNANGDYVVDKTSLKQAWDKLNPPPSITEGMSDTDKYQLQSAWRARKRMSSDEQRRALHDDFLSRLDNMPMPQSEVQPTETIPQVSPSEIQLQPNIADNKSTSADYDNILAANTEDIIPKDTSITEAGESADDLNKQLENSFNKGAQTAKDLYIQQHGSLPSFKTKSGDVVNAPPSKQTSDSDEYNQLYSEMQEMMAKGDTGSPEFISLWKQLETVKNRNKGMPPSGSVNDQIISNPPKEFQKLQPSEMFSEQDSTAERIVHNGVKGKTWEKAYPRLVLEGTGDIYRELTKYNEGYYSKGYIDEKLNRLDRWLSNKQVGSGGSFEQDFKNSFEVNPENHKALAEAYSKLPWQNEGQFYAKRLTQNLALGKFENARYASAKLKEWLNNNPAKFSAPVDIHNKTLNEGLQQHIAKGKANVGSVLGHIANSTENDYAPLAKHLLEITPKEKLSDVVQTGVSKDGRSGYHVGEKKVVINPADINDSHIVMHELAHAVTVHNLPEEFRGLRGAELDHSMNKYLSNPNGHEGVKEIIRSYYEAVNNVGIHDELFNDKFNPNTEKVDKGTAGAPDEVMRNNSGMEEAYGLGDLHEFTSMALTNKKFQRLLDSMPSGLSDNKSLWSRFVESIRKILGVSPREGSLLERTLKATEDIVKTTRDVKFDNEAENEFHAPPSKPEREKTNTMGFIGRAFRAGIDTVRSMNHPSANMVADAFQKTLVKKEQIMGKQWNPIGEITRKLSTRDKEQLEKISRYELENETKAPETMFRNSNQRKAYDIAKVSLKENFDNRFKNGEPVTTPSGGKRLPISDPFYWPTTGNPKVTALYRSNEDSVAIAKLDKTFKDYYVNKLGRTPEEANGALAHYKAGIQGTANSSGTGNNTFFNAARKSQGLPLPPEFTRPGWDDNLEAYFHAQSADNSYYEHIEKNPKVMAALGEKVDAWGHKIPADANGSIAGNTAVKNIINELKGEASGGLQGQTIKKAESLATAGILGPLTEIHKVVSNWTKQLTYADNPIQAAKSISAAIHNWGEGWTHAKENGKVVLTAKSAMDMFDGQLTGADRLAGLARGMRKIYTLNDLTDKFNLGALQAANESLIPFKINSANEGDRNAIRLMQHLDTEWTSGKVYSKKDISQLASNLSGVIHGTHDARTLPSWMLHDNEISAFLKLSSWGISQTNSFMRDVWTPATQGNLAPLLNATMGAAVGGYILKELREKISGKRSQIPSLGEIASSSRGFKGNVPALAYNAMAAASYAGFGGMLSTIARYPFDFAFRNTPQGATFPLDTVVTDLGNTITKTADAIANDPHINWLMLGEAVGSHIMSTDFQLGRVALNQAINAGTITGTLAEKKQLSDKLGELRRFDMVENIPYSEMGGGSETSYMNLEQKKFKTEQDPQKAMQMLPSLIQDIVKKYGNNPDVMLEKIKSLKQNSYETFPSLETTPLEFSKYISYLNKEKGQGAAQEALMDYVKHKAINQMKSSVVP